jgi:hypothetical protein
VSERLDPAPLPDGLGISAEDWQQTPLSVRLVVLTLLKRLEALASRLHQDSSKLQSAPINGCSLNKTSTTEASGRATQGRREAWAAWPSAGAVGANGNRYPFS